MPLKTRERVKAMARKMGYHPDPLLSALIAYRSDLRPRGEYGKIAILHDWKRETSLFPAWMRLYIDGVAQQAVRYGYETELFFVSGDEYQNRALSRQLFSRGITGVVVTPLRISRLLLTWEYFSCVTLGENLNDPQLNKVIHDHEWALQSSYQKLRELGYRKIGYCNDEECEIRQHEAFLGAYLKCLYLDGQKLDDSPPFLYDEKKKWSPLAWLKRNRFDAILAMAPDVVLESLQGSRLRVPRDLGIAGFVNHDEATAFAGYVIDYLEAGVAAMDLLHASLLRGQRGVPPENEFRSVSLRGHWRSGPTVRATNP